jgi:hypothetical protein
MEKVPPGMAITECGRSVGVKTDHASSITYRYCWDINELLAPVIHE